MRKNGDDYDDDYDDDDDYFVSGKSTNTETVREQASKQWSNRELRHIHSSHY